MRSSGSQPRVAAPPGAGPPPPGRMRSPPPAPPRPCRSPRFLRNRAARSRGGALHPEARESPLAFLSGGWWPLGPLWPCGLRCGAGRAVPACQVRGGRAGGGHGVAAGGRRRGLLRGPASAVALGTRGVWAGGDRSNCRHPRGVRGSPPGVRPPHLRNRTCKFGRKIVQFWLLEGPRS